MDIKETVIQGLIKEAGSDKVTENFRSDLTPVNKYMVALGEELLKVYGRATNNYGSFDNDHETYRFPHHLSEYLASKTDLVDFSQSACRLIALQMKSSKPATGGYSCFLRYQNQGKDWLFIVMLKLKAHIGINEKSVELNENLAFDINHLHEAARIDLGKWESNEEPYLSFIKRNGRQDEVTRYFRMALGCTTYTDAKVNTEHALDAVTQYCNEYDLTPDERQEARKSTFEYFDEQHKAGQPATLLGLSARINGAEPEKFLEFVKDKEIPVNDSFSPHKKTFDRFRRITGKFGSIRIAFSAEDAINGIVDYDAATNKLLIKDPSATLIQEIAKAKGHDAADEPS